MKILALLLALLCACNPLDKGVDVGAGSHASAQAVNPNARSIINVVDGGVCTGNGTTTSKLDCHLTVDTSTLGGNGAGTALNANVTLSSLTFALLGDGSDSGLHFDGTSTLTMRDGTTLAPVGSSPAVYTMVNDLFCDGCTIDANVTVIPAGYRIFDHGSLTLNGKIAWNGNAASGATGGAALTTTFLGGTTANGGGNGGAGGGGASTAGGAGSVQFGPSGTWCSNTGGGAGNPGATGGACRGGGGGTGGDGAASAAGTTSVSAASVSNFRVFTEALSARQNRSATSAAGGGGGGGGGRGASTPTAAGGGGGGGGGYIVVLAKSITGSGSIEAKGGNGADGAVTNNTGGGGGGGGGTVAVLIATGSSPTITLTGGTHGAGHGTGGNGGDGGAGISIVFKVGL